ncbi:MAG: glycosyltransferase [Chloroflexota bacterium]
MRIIYFSRDYTTHDLRFLSALAQTQHEVFFLRLENKGRVLESQPLPGKVTQIHWKGGSSPARWQDGLGLLMDLKRVIRTYRPDIVHAGTIQTAAFLTALAGFRPLVSMSWGYDLLMDAHRNLYWEWATRYTLKRSEVMVGDCDIIRRLAVNYGMAAGHIISFPWGTNLDHFHPSREDSGLRQHLGWKEEETFVILSTRGWSPIYGIEELARGFALAAQQSSKLRLLMLGGGSQEDFVKHIFRQANVLDKVYFAGQISFQDLPEYYRAADLYVSASHSDGTSISLLEALACGVPVLVSDIPGNQEWVTPDVGWQFPLGNSNVLSQRLLDVVRNNACLPEMGRAARLLAEQRGDWDKNFLFLLEAYQRAVGNGKNIVTF